MTDNLVERKEDHVLLILFQLDHSSARCSSLLLTGDQIQARGGVSSSYLATAEGVQ